MKIYSIIILIMIVSNLVIAQTKDIRNKTGMKKINIEVQYFNGCPNSSELLKRVKKAIAGNDEDISFKEVLIETNELAQELKFRGSPTLLINGKDYEGLEEPTVISLSCRYYAKGLPSIDGIKRKIKAHR